MQCTVLNIIYIGLGPQQGFDIIGSQDIVIYLFQCQNEAFCQYLSKHTHLHILCLQLAAAVFMVPSMLTNTEEKKPLL